MSRTSTYAGLAALLAVDITVTALSLRASWAEGTALLCLLGVQWLCFGLAVLLMRRLPRRSAVLIVLAGALALQAVAVSVPPRRSDDVYRYVWDGRVQAAGIDPYRYPPTDPALVRLRDPWLFPDAAGCADLRRAPGCSRINRADERTVYPPVAEAAFAGVSVVDRGRGTTVWQWLCAAMALAVTALLLRPRGRAGPYAAALWAWCPVAVLETGNGAHIDVLTALLGLAALSLVTARRPGWAGALIGAAVAVKLYPVLLLGVLRRGSAVAAGLVAASVVAVVYLPHLLAVGPQVIGYLPGYLREEGYDGGRRFGLLAAVLPDSITPLAAVAVLAALALHVQRSALAPENAALVIFGGALLVAAPYQGWYGLLLVALIARTRRWEWLGVAAAASVQYAVPSVQAERIVAQRAAYGLALVLVVAVTLWRRRAGRLTASSHGGPESGVGSARGRQGALRRAYPVRRQADLPTLPATWESAAARCAQSRDVFRRPHNQ